MLLEKWKIKRADVVKGGTPAKVKTNNRFHILTITCVFFPSYKILKGVSNRHISNHSDVA